MKLERFLLDLGSAKGSPGGGAAAALTGALGAALVEMTAGLNDKRLKHSSGNALRARLLRKKLHRLMATDQAAFGRIQEAYAKRKSAPASWQSALKNGASIPLAVCLACVESSRVAKKERSRTSAWLESDRREALTLLRAAFDSARLNVEINLKGIRDTRFKTQTQRKLTTWRRSL